MTPHLARSRVTKALTDANIAASFAAAEARLDAVHPCVVVGAQAAHTAAGQCAALTAVATAYKCFGRIQLAGEGLDTPLLQPLPIGRTLGAAAQALGAHVAAAIEPATTHLVRIENSSPWQGWQVFTWWNRWLAGTRPFPQLAGCPSFALAGMFAGALAVRQIFANIRNNAPPRDESVSLWEPDQRVDPDRIGPARFTMPNRLWLVGLGHLGQAFVWGLLALPFQNERHIILQDDQWIGVENESTSLLVGTDDIGRRKVRVAARWLDHTGWTTELIERRHLGDIRRTEQDPSILLAGLDDVRPRRVLAAQGFDYMIDAGIGHGARDFESLQIRTIPAGAPIESLWLDQSQNFGRDHLMAKDAYRALEQVVGQCGVVPLADASVSVPFVGAATAALGLAQLARLGSMAPAASLLQLELGAPSMVLPGQVSAAPSSFLGGETFVLS